MNSILNLAMIMLALRFFLWFVGLRAGLGLLGRLTAVVYGLTGIVIAPIALVVPSVAVFGHVVELSTLVAILALDTVASLLAQSATGSAGLRRHEQENRASAP